jgi:hypothetical protein
MDAQRTMTVYFYTNGKPQRKPDKLNITLEDIMAGRGIRVAKNDKFLYNDKVLHHTNGAELKKLRSVVDQSKFVLVPLQEKFVSAPYEEMFFFHYGNEEEKKKMVKMLMVDKADPEKLFCPHHNRYCKHISHSVKKQPKGSCCANCCGDDDDEFTAYTVSPTSSKRLEVESERSPPKAEQQRTDDYDEKIADGKKLVTVDVKSTPTSSTVRDLGRQMERIDFECTHGTHAMKIYRFGRRRGHRVSLKVKATNRKELES